MHYLKHCIVQILFPLTKQQTKTADEQEVVMPEELKFWAFKLTVFKVSFEDVPVDSLASNLVDIRRTTKRICR